MSYVTLEHKPTGQEVERYVDEKFCVAGNWVRNLQKDLELLADRLGYEFKDEPAKRVLVKKETK